ncbi:MAG: glucosidase [Acidobacteria bacterium]|nr:glucosidase [Acidobacteriota bacterium]
MEREPAARPQSRTLTKEEERLYERSDSPVPAWRRWGPYLSERSWGTVREDYSPDGDAWNYLPHDAARSKAYRWGEDGIGGISDRYQLLCFAPTFWNGRDPILKERLFGLTSGEGNHGEDVKEYYFYLDNTPTHSYMKMLYKYPQREFPYSLLVEENRRRGGRGREFELLDTGIFDDDRYFDIFIEYAKADAEDICIRIEACNRGPDAAELHIIPTLWFRNTWGWTDPPGTEPEIRRLPSDENSVLWASDSEPLHNLVFEYSSGNRFLYGPPGAQLLFTNNETNAERVYGSDSRSRRRHHKDAFHRYLVQHEDCLRHDDTGSKACFVYRRVIPAGESEVLYLRLTPDQRKSPLKDIDKIFQLRRKEADEFYATVHPPYADAEEKMIQRQAFAGMLWSKQIYLFDVSLWLEGDDRRFPPAQSRKTIRNHHWRHLNSMRILSVPDKWEYPWFAAWDLAFQCTTLAMIDAEFAKENLWVMLFEQFQHPNGQIPAYEWEFSDLNPPVHAWAVWRVYNRDYERNGVGDKKFLEKCFHKLLINFAWWVNKVDREGNNVFEGGFLGLDNIAVIDRSEKLPDGAVLEQSDATGWMGFFCLYLMRIALELAEQDDVYESLAIKFFEHFIYIGSAMKHMGGRRYTLWDQQENFFYDVLRLPNGQFHKFRVRSLVGLIPLYANEVIYSHELNRHKEFLSSVKWFMNERPDLAVGCYTDPRPDHDVHVLSIIDERQLRGLLERLWDEGEFLSQYGFRSLSKVHERLPFRFGTQEVRYEPAEADAKIKGGNSNWRGPLWFPTSYLLIRSLKKYGDAMGPEWGIHRGGKLITPNMMAENVANRMINLFKRDAEGKRPIYGNNKKFQEDPHWRDYLLFYEYFHGDTGEGLGASHQTGWTGLVANLIHEWRRNPDHWT